MSTEVSNNDSLPVWQPGLEPPLSQGMPAKVDPNRQNLLQDDIQTNKNLSNANLPAQKGLGNLEPGNPPGVAKASAVRGPLGAGNPWMKADYIVALRVAVELATKHMAEQRFESQEATMEAARWMQDEALSAAAEIMASGEAQAQIHEAEARQHMINGVALAIGAGVTMGSFAAMKGMEFKQMRSTRMKTMQQDRSYAKQAKTASRDHYLQKLGKVKPQNPADQIKLSKAQSTYRNEQAEYSRMQQRGASPAQLSKQQAKIDHAKADYDHINENAPRDPSALKNRGLKDAKSKYEKDQAKLDKADQAYHGERNNIIQNNVQYRQMTTQLVEQVSRSVQEFTQSLTQTEIAGLTRAKAQHDANREINESYKKMADTLMQTSERDAKDAREAIAKFMQELDQKLSQIYKTFGIGVHGS